MNIEESDLGALYDYRKEGLYDVVDRIRQELKDDLLQIMGYDPDSARYDIDEERKRLRFE